MAETERPRGLPADAEEVKSLRILLDVLAVKTDRVLSITRYRTLPGGTKVYTVQQAGRLQAASAIYGHNVTRDEAVIMLDRMKMGVEPGDWLEIIELGTKPQAVRIDGRR